jgi:hypothetical protein
VDDKGNDFFDLVNQAAVAVGATQRPALDVARCVGSVVTSVR